MKNKNKTYDIGPMQINSSWLPTLARYVITQHDLQYDACKNIEVGTWILSKMIANGKDLISGIGDYRSHTASINKHYGSMVKINYAKNNDSQQIAKDNSKIFSLGFRHR